MLLMQGYTIKSPGADLYWSVPGKQTTNANSAFSLKLLLKTRRGKITNEVLTWLGRGLDWDCHTRMYREWFQDNIASRQQEGQPEGKRGSSIPVAL